MAYTDPAGVKIQGLKQALKALQEIGVPAEEIKAANQTAGQLVLNESRSLAPVRSGKLRDSIRLNKALNKVTISAGNNTRIPYANPIHWGWFKRNIKPQPFFVKALGITRDEVYKTYNEQLNKAIQKNSTKGIPTDD